MAIRSNGRLGWAYLLSFIKYPIRGQMMPVKNTDELSPSIELFTS
jgi:hypothetical protein